MMPACTNTRITYNSVAGKVDEFNSASMSRSIYATQLLAGPIPVAARSRSASALLLVLRVRIPPGA